MLSSICGGAGIARNNRDTCVAFGEGADRNELAEHAARKFEEESGTKGHFYFFGTNARKKSITKPWKA